MRTFLCLLALSAAAPAQERAIVLRASRLFDGKADKLVSPGVVVVVSDRIQAVGAAAAIPAGA